MSWIVYAIVAVVLLFYVVVPIVVWRTLRFLAAPEVDDRDDATLPQEVRFHFGSTADALETQGFVREPPFFVRLVAKGSLNLVQPMSHPESGVIALAYAIRQNADLHTYVEFVSRYPDGVTIDTNNTDRILGFVRTPHKYVACFPDQPDPVELYGLHQRWVERRGRPATVPDQRGASVKERMLSAMADELQEQAELGYLTTSSGARGYRLTAKGALLLTWKQLPPWKQLARVARDWRGRQVAKS